MSASTAPARTSSARSPPGCWTGAPQNQFAIVLDGLVISRPGNDIITNGRRSSPATSPESRPERSPPAQVRGAADLVRGAHRAADLGDPRREQLRSGLLAGLIGLLLVVLYSLLQYRALGLVTVASLVIAG